MDGIRCWIKVRIHQVIIFDASSWNFTAGQTSIHFRADPSVKPNHLAAHDLTERPPSAAGLPCRETAKMVSRVPKLER